MRSRAKAVVGAKYLIGASLIGCEKKDHAPSSDVGHDPVMFDKIVVPAANTPHRAMNLPGRISNADR
jgi:hypothetical protein